MVSIHAKMASTSMHLNKVFILCLPWKLNTHSMLTSEKGKWTTPSNSLNFNPRFTNQRAREVTSSVFHSPSSYLYHLMSPSSLIVRSHMVHESFMHVKNSRNLEAALRILSSSSFITLFIAGSGWAFMRWESMRRQCDMLSTSRCFNPSKILSKASFNSTEHLRLRIFNLGRNATSVLAKKT